MRKANPAIYRRAAEIVDADGNPHPSCEAICEAQRRLPEDENRAARLYRRMLDHEKDPIELNRQFWKAPSYDALREHRVFALLFCAEWCRGMSLPK